MKTPTRLYNRKRLNDRMIDELIGMAKGITADGVVNQAEAEYLLQWMEENAVHATDNVINSLFASIEDMLADNFLDDEEKDDLLVALKGISGEQCAADKTHTTSATFPLNIPEPEVFPEGCVFCLTGSFAYGPRKDCREIIEEARGIFKDTVTLDTTYLVIGTLTSPDWAHASYGRKIEKAMEYRELYGEPQIISEDTWAKYLIRCSPPKQEPSPQKQTPPPKKEFPPAKVRRLTLPGQMITLSPLSKDKSPGPLEEKLEKVKIALLNKGWCVAHRHGFVVLNGYGSMTKDFVSLADRNPIVIYKDYTNKEGEPKTREYHPRDDDILSIGSISLVGKNGNIERKWEVKTLWTMRRNLFDDFTDAWRLFLEIEERYDPGTIVWSKLEEYDEFEKY